MLAINLPLHNQPATSAQEDDTGGFHEILRLGRGGIHNVEWHPTEPLILVDTARGAWLYDDTLADVGYLPDIRLAHFSPDGEYIAGVNLDQGIEIWEAVTQTHLMTLHGHMDYVTTLEWNPDSQTLATGDETGQLIVWDVMNGEQLNIFDAGSEFYRLKWSPSGQHFVILNEQGVLRGHKQDSSTLQLIHKDIYSPYNSYHFNWIDDKTLIYSNSESGSICCSYFLNIENPEQSPETISGDKYVEINLTQNVLATSSWGYLEIYDLSDLSKFKSISPSENSHYYLSELTWSSNGEFLAVGKRPVGEEEHYPLIDIYDADFVKPIIQIEGHKYGTLYVK